MRIPMDPTVIAGPGVKDDPGEEDRILRYNDVSSLAVTSDGARVVAGRENGLVQVIDAIGQRTIYSMRPSEGRVWDLCITADDETLLTTSGDAVIIWELATGRQLRSLSLNDENEIESVTLLPDDKTVVTASVVSDICVWDSMTGTLACQMDADPSGQAGTRATCTPDGSRIVSFSADATPRTWAQVWMIDGTPIRTLEIPSKEGCWWDARLTPDGRQLVTFVIDWDTPGEHCSPRVWNLDNGTCEHVLQGHRRTVASVAFTPDSSRAVTASADSTCKIWNLRTGTCEHTLAGHSDFVFSVGVTPDGRRAVSGSKDGTVRIWDIASGKLRRTHEHALRNRNYEVMAVWITPDGKSVIYDDNVGQLHCIPLG
jgi:WD40 repeat protein